MYCNLQTVTLQIWNKSWQVGLNKISWKTKFQFKIEVAKMFSKPQFHVSNKFETLEGDSLFISVCRRGKTAWLPLGGSI